MSSNAPKQSVSNGTFTHIIFVYLSPQCGQVVAALLIAWEQARHKCKSVLFLGLFIDLSKSNKSLHPIPHGRVETCISLLVVEGLVRLRLA